MTVTTDEGQVLRVLADEEGPVPSTEALSRVNPYPFGTGPDRRRLLADWRRRNRQLWDAEEHLLELGLIEGIEQARQITDAGRELARTKLGGTR